MIYLGGVPHSIVRLLDSTRDDDETRREVIEKLVEEVERLREIVMVARALQVRCSASTSEGTRQHAENLRQALHHYDHRW